MAYIPHEVPEVSQEEMSEKAKAFYELMDQRRSVREFSDRPVAKEIIENIILTASTAPSGAHKQPWTFCAINNAEIKRKIKEAAEEEEYTNYHGRMSEEWLKDLAVFETDWHKPFLEIAPWIIVVFKRIFEKEEATKKQNYYVNESVGLSAGFLLAAIHQAGLVSLTHTPSPMNFLKELLQRPDNERPFLLIPVGYPAENVKVPDLKRKTIDDVAVFLE